MYAVVSAPRMAPGGVLTPLFYPNSRQAEYPILCSLRWYRPVIIADLFDLAVHDLHDLGPDRLNNPPFPWTGTVEARFRHAAAVVAGARTQVAATVGEERKAGLVRAPHLLPPLKPPALSIHNDRMVVEAGYHALDVVAGKMIKETRAEVVLLVYRARPPLSLNYS